MVDSPPWVPITEEGARRMGVLLGRRDMVWRPVLCFPELPICRAYGEWLLEQPHRPNALAIMWLPVASINEQFGPDSTDAMVTALVTTGLPVPYWSSVLTIARTCE